MYEVVMSVSLGLELVAREPRRASENRSADSTTSNLTSSVPFEVVNQTGRLGGVKASREGRTKSVSPAEKNLSMPPTGQMGKGLRSFPLRERREN